MRTRFVEATQNAARGFNLGKFMVGVFDGDEWTRPSAVGRAASPSEPFGTIFLLGQRGWTQSHVFVLDLETGEGAMFRPGGSPSADLDKHRIWVCPMFEPFLAWLYAFVARADEEGLVAHETPGGKAYKLPWLNALPSLVELPGAPAERLGYRRPGPEASAEGKGVADA